MSDLIARLRNAIPWQGKSEPAFLCHQAADAIERLERENARLETIAWEASEAEIGMAQKLDAAESRLSALQAERDALAGALSKTEWTHLTCDYIPAGDDAQPEGWRIHDFPANPNEHGVWFAHWICGGMEEDDARAIVACVNSALSTINGGA